MGFILALALGFLPIFFYAWLIYWVDRYEKEPGLLLGVVFTWGVVIAAGGAYLINTIMGMSIYLVTGSEAASNLSTGSLIAPVVEESLKGLAVLLVYWLFRQEFDSILDGIVYAGIVALGFAATENAFFIYNGYIEDGFRGLLMLAFVRIVLVGWQHPFYTAFIGIGLAAARLAKPGLLRLAYPVAGWMVAVITHSLHNTLANLLHTRGNLLLGTLFDWSGWLAMLVFILWMLAREQKNLQLHLLEEVASGVISAAQYRTACSAWAQSYARLQAVFNGSYAITARFYQVCGEIAHKKHQRSRLPDDQASQTIIDSLRTELARLSQAALPVSLQ
jgi:RsiW-degrading membrane proteinase PrsW (M82 family)